MTPKAFTPEARAAIDAHWQNGGTVLLSAVTVWEIACLVDAGRLDLDIPVEAWVERFLDCPGIEPVWVDYRAAARSYELHHLEHRDPADRLLIATARLLQVPIITRDSRILSYARAGFVVAIPC